MLFPDHTFVAITPLEYAALHNVKHYILAKRIKDKYGISPQIHISSSGFILLLGWTENDAKRFIQAFDSGYVSLTRKGLVDHAPRNYELKAINAVFDCIYLVL